MIFTRNRGGFCLKKFVIVCILFILFLTGCNKKTETKPILNDIEFDVNITYYNENYTAKGSIDGENKLYLKIIEPAELETMEISLDGDDVEIGYKGLTYKPNENMILSSAAGLFYTAINDLRSDNAEIEYGEKNYSVSVKNKKGEIFMNFSPSGLPLDIKYASGVLGAEFSNLKSLKNE